MPLYVKGPDGIVRPTKINNLGELEVSESAPSQDMRAVHKSKKERFQDELANIDSKKANIINILKEIESAKFSPGDFAIHPEYGNVIIHDVLVPSESKYLDGVIRPRLYDKTGQGLSEVHYVVNTPLHYDLQPVAESELLELNSASKTLFGKK
jgi:hypothetical protein